MKRVSLGLALLLGIGLTVPLVACGGGGEEARPTPTKPPTAATPTTLTTPTAQATQAQGGIPAVSGTPTVTATGLQIIDIKVGTGASPQTGQTVEVHYTGWLADGTKFDSSVDRGQTFSFVLGGQVIKGWNEGVASMKVGGQRRLIIPPALGYGTSGAPPRIPANAQLIFDVELLSIK
ncbi:MAG: FKBP-type peptidyl-prolyl cis-trans isomerase [Dehalococcoidia bacterium]|nr:FKBP-type peptidyl-prolyl cis-trans isomerase [Dehalococcoidia bacterium]